MKNQKVASCFYLSVFIAFLGTFVVSSVLAEVIYQEEDGVVVCEAELYSSRIDHSNGKSWAVVPDEHAGVGSITNARGGAFIQCLPDNTSGGSLLSVPEIHYKMHIQTPGTYQLYLRRDGNKHDASGGTSGGNADSMFMDILELKDGTTPEFDTSTNLIADWYEATGSVDGDFSTTPWRSIGAAEINEASAVGDECDWYIPTQGVYTLRFTMREDGAAVDSFVFQLKDLSAPTGDGPAISSFEQSHLAFVATDDTFLMHDQPTTPYGTNEFIIVKNAQELAPSGVDRNIYLRFDISDFNAFANNQVIVTNAALKIYLHNEGIGTNHNIYVAVIAEDATAETFDEDTLTPDTSDVWNNSTDEAVDFTKIYGMGPVGSFVISSSNEPAFMMFDDPGLLRAIRADTDGVFSVVLYREMDNVNFDYFASKEHPSYSPPILDFKYFLTNPGTSIIVF